MLYVWIGRAKTGKSGRILERIRELGDDGKQILLVPEHASHEAEADLCRVCGDTASRHAEVLSFHRLGERVLSRTGGLSDVIPDAGGQLLILQRCVGELSPSLTVYRRPSQRPAFLRQMLDLFDELRAYEISPELLNAKAEETSGATRDKLSDLSLLYGAYESRLRGEGRDGRDRMSKLCDHLEESEYVDGRELFLDGFTYFNAQERRVLEICLRRCKNVTIALLGERDSHEEMFRPALRTLEQLERLAQSAGCGMNVEEMRTKPIGALGHLERYFFQGGQPYQPENDPDAGQSNKNAANRPSEHSAVTGQSDKNADAGPIPIHIREADSVLTEVEQTAADIIRLTASGKARFRDITVAARNMSDYEGSIESVFARWKIPVYLSRRSDILEKPAVSVLTGALSAVTNGYEYDDMFRWLKTGLSGLSIEECDILENYVLKWEIHGGMWLRDVPWTENPDGYGARWEEEQVRRLETVNQLRERVREPLNELAQGLKTGKTAARKADALYTFMERLNLQDALETRMKEQAARGKLQDAEETAQLWEILCGVLDQFTEILGGESIDTDTFVRLFRQILTQYSVGTIPVSLDQVSVSEITRNDRHTVKYLFLLGANDHVLPMPTQSGGILNQDDRHALARIGMELAPADMEQMCMELQNLYAALAQPTEGLTVSYPISDASGAALHPSFVVERILRLFPSLRVDKESVRKDYRLTAKIPALETAGQNINGPLWQYLERAGTHTPQLDAMRRAAVLRRGALSRHAVRLLYGERFSMSASRLERMRSCHFAYFMEYGLQAKARHTAAFDAPQIGSFLHYLLENVTRDALSMGGFATVDDDTLHELVDQYIREFIAKEFGDLSGKSARFRYLFTRLRRTARNIIDQTAEELRHSDFVPLAFELSFGDGRDLPAVVISEPGAQLRVKGYVDRMDGWRKNGKIYLRVVDYKSGRKKFELGAVRMGLDIQMLLYLFALRDNGGRRFGPEIEPAGALYIPARDEILPAAREITPEELAEKRAKTLRRSGLILSDPDVLQAMEHEVLREPHYLPVSVKKDGSISGSLATAEQMGKLGRYVDRLLHEITQELRQGNINADPCGTDPDNLPCRYCDWFAACCFRDGRDTDHMRYVPTLDAPAFWDLVEQDIGPENASQPVTTHGNPARHTGNPTYHTGNPTRHTASERT